MAPVDVAGVRGEEEAEGEEGDDADAGHEALRLLEGVDDDEGGDGRGHGQVAQAAGQRAAEQLLHEVREGEDGRSVEGVAEEGLQNLEETPFVIRC